MAKDENARWLVNQRTFVGHSLCDEGTEVTYNPPEGGEVAENLTPLNDTAQAIVDAQKSAHPDKSKAKSVKAPRAGKEAAADAKDTGGDADKGGDEDVA